MIDLALGEFAALDGDDTILFFEGVNVVEHCTLADALKLWEWRQQLADLLKVSVDRRLVLIELPVLP